LYFSAVILLAAIVPVIIYGLAKPGLIRRWAKVFTSSKGFAAKSLASVMALVAIVALAGPSSAGQSSTGEQNANQQTPLEIKQPLQSLDQANSPQNAETKSLQSPPKPPQPTSEPNTKQTEEKPVTKQENAENRKAAEKADKSSTKQNTNCRSMLNAFLSRLNSDTNCK